LKGDVIMAKKKCNPVLIAERVEEDLHKFEEAGEQLRTSLEEARVTREIWLEALPEARAEIVREKYPEFAKTLRRS
jgi:hypothetical protein